MADFPSGCVQAPKHVIAGTGRQAIYGQFNANTAPGSATAVWPSANLALFVAVTIDLPVLAQQMAIVVTIQSGNVDVGIYDEKGGKIVTKGTTAVAAAGVQVFDITDTVLDPGTYWLAMACDNVTASFQKTTPSIAAAQISGVQQMATAFVLPATATFANPANTYVPAISLLCAATV